MKKNKTSAKDAILAAGLLPVSDDIVTKVDGRKVRSFTVGRAVVTHDGCGGKACWIVTLDGAIVGGLDYRGQPTMDYRGNAIMRAIEVQTHG